MGLLGNSKWGPGGANDNDDAESSTPPPDAFKAPRSQKSNKDDRVSRWKKEGAARNMRAAGNEEPGILGNGIDHGYGTSAGRAAPNSSRPQHAAEGAIDFPITRDDLPQDTMLLAPNPQDTWNASRNGRTTVRPTNLTQPRDTSAPLPPRTSPYERMALAAFPAHTNTHPSLTADSTSHAPRQAMVPQPLSDSHVQEDETTPTQSTFAKAVEGKFAVEPASIQGAKPVLKRPAVKVVGSAYASTSNTASSTPIAASSTATLSAPIPTFVNNASKEEDTTTFRIPPQSNLSDSDYFFLLGKLRGRTVSVAEWDATVERLEAVGMGLSSTIQPPPRFSVQSPFTFNTPGASSTVTVTATANETDVEDAELAREVGGKGKGKERRSVSLVSTLPSSILHPRSPFTFQPPAASPTATAPATATSDEAEEDGETAREMFAQAASKPERSLSFEFARLAAWEQVEGEEDEL